MALDLLHGDRREGRVNSSIRPSFRDYLKMLADRPPKFDAKQVEYRKSDGDQDCGTCVHFYQSEAADRSVCEIFRPDKDESVKPDWTCDFWTSDGVRFPLLDKK